MKIYEKATEFLVENGMFEAQAKDVISIAKERPENAVWSKRWSDDIEGYPASALAVLLHSVKSSAIEWIDVNLPEAWYRPLFADETT